MNETLSVTRQQGLNRFLAKSLLWMMVGLLVSTASAYVLLRMPYVLYTILNNRLLYFGLFIVQLFLAYSLRVDPSRLEQSASYITKFMLYSTLTGFTFAVVSLVYLETSIVQAFISTAALFAMLSIFGYTTKKDLTRMGTFLLTTLLGVIIISIVNFFFYSSLLSFILSTVTLVIFSGLTMYDMQKLKALYLFFENSPTLHTSLSIACALELYLDFINIFLSILRLFGRTKD